MKKTNLTLSIMALMLVNLAACENKFINEDQDLVDNAILLDDEHDHQSEDDHLRIMEEQREMQYLDAKNPERVSSGSCKYISSISKSPPQGKVVMTFDDGPDATLTPYVLDVLKKHGIKATFFMKGVNAAAHPGIVKRAVAEGHLVSSHSWNHPNFHELPFKAQRAQIVKTEEPLGANMKKPLRFFRYPFGNSTCQSNELARERGYGIVGWHVDTCDWAYAKTGQVTEKQARICEVRASNISDFAGHVLQQTRAHGGGIILMHDVHTRTIGQLDQLLKSLKAEGYRFSNLNDPEFKAYLR